MKFYKILALVYADFLLVRNSKWRLVEYLYFPITTVLIYGLFSLFVKSYAPEAGLIVLSVNILWAFAQLAQSHVNMSMNEDSWSGSLKQIITSGVSDMEYITARVLSSIVISLGVLALIVAISASLFGLGPLAASWETMALLIASTLIASIGLSIIVAGMMVALGREYGFLAWTMMQGFILLSAPFYPVQLFPGFLQPIVSVMPYTNIFEAARQTVSGGAAMGAALNGFYVSIAYLLVSLPFYRAVFRQALRKGWLVRLS